MACRGRINDRATTGHGGPEEGSNVPPGRPGHPCQATYALTRGSTTGPG
jgi:hypothetical protein